MAVSAFAPLHLQVPFRLSARGVQGAAVVLQEGVVSRVRASGRAASPGAARPALSISLNAEPDAPPALLALHRAFASHLDSVPISLEQSTPLPPSWSSALLPARLRSMALALNAWCAHPLAAPELERLVDQAARRSRLPGVWGSYMGGGLLWHLPDSPAGHRPLTPAELRLPLRLTPLGRAPPSSPPSPRAVAQSARGARSTSRLRPLRSPPARVGRSLSAHFRAQPKLLSLLAAARVAAQSTGSVALARLLAERPHAAALPELPALLEPGVGSLHPPLSRAPSPSDRAPLRPLILHPSNLGARLL